MHGRGRSRIHDRGRTRAHGRGRAREHSRGQAKEPDGYLGKHPCEDETLAKRQGRQDLSSTADIIAANPAAAGLAGLAAEAAGAVAGGTEDPLGDVRAIFTTLGMTITQRDGMINAHNIMGMNNFDYIRVDDDGSSVKVWNDTS